MDVAAKGDEQNLVDFARRVSAKVEGRIVLIFKLSEFDASNGGSTRFAITKKSLEAFNNIIQGNLFFLANDDSVLASSNVNVETLHDVIGKVAKIYNDDLSEFEVLPSYIEILHLETQSSRFSEIANEMLENAEARLKQIPSIEKRNDVDGMVGNAKFEAHHLARMEDVLAHTDIGSILRHQSAFSMKKLKEPKILFSEYYISLGSLAQSIMPEVDITSNMLLMRQLTKTLDDRLLRWLKHEQGRVSGKPFSLNLNMETTSGELFLEMVHHVWSPNQQTIVIELSLFDVLENLEEYNIILPYLKERGYMILIDAIRPCDLLTIQLKNLKADLYKIRWNSLLKEDEYQQALGAFVDNVTSGRVIMCHCDSKDALSVGLPLKVYNYQGRFLDSYNQ